MPRLGCLDAPGVVHHVIMRGIERRRTSTNNADRVREDAMGAIGAYLCYLEGGLHLDMSVSGVGYTVQRGEAIAHNDNYQLID